MFARLLQPPPTGSYFLFGPRGTGKTSWIRATYPHAVYVDLLDSDVYTPLLASPRRLETYLAGRGPHTVVIDEVQKVPALLDEVHRLIAARKARFVMTGSSARKLRRAGVNLLAGRARTHAMFPLTVRELGDAFDLDRAIVHGLLPEAWTATDAPAFLRSYVATYLKEEVQQEGLTRSLASFARFLEAASFSQGSMLNISAVSRECSVPRKTVEDYFVILEDLLIGVRLPVFTRRAKRAMVAHPKFYLFDAGVYRAVRPAGPLDSPEEIAGAALETLLFQELRALNSYLDLGYALHYWRAATGEEVDFVLYGPRGLVALEIKRSRQIRSGDLRGLAAFRSDYPAARTCLLYGGQRRLRESGIELIPIEQGLRQLPDLLA